MTMPRLSQFELATYKTSITETLLLNSSALSKLRKLYRVADQVVSPIAQLSVCSVGCSHCCKIPVPISRLEAEYIGRCSAYKPRIVSRGNVFAEIHQPPCAFLSKNSTCSVYDSRPFVCRTFFALDHPEYCKTPEKEHLIYGAGQALLKRIHGEILHLNGKHNQVADIRVFFPATT